MERRQLFRLCHSCGHLNESDQEILRCAKCARSFLPINYFEKIRAKLASGVATDAPAELPNLVGSPINGLIVFW